MLRYVIKITFNFDEDWDDGTPINEQEFVYDYFENDEAVVEWWHWHSAYFPGDAEYEIVEKSPC